MSESLRQASHRLPAASASLASKACHQKGDISDWIDQGGTQAELETLVELTEPLGRAQPTEPTTHPEVDGEPGFGLDDFYAYMAMHTYRPSTLRPGNPRGSATWVKHLHKLYPQEARHIIAFLAHRVQRPKEKINHAIVLGGPRGIGKDTMLEPVKHAVGPWNFCEASPKAILGNTTRSSSLSSCASVKRAISETLIASPSSRR